LKRSPPVATKVEKSIVVDVPVETAYNQWTQFEEFPHFMSGISEIRQLDDTTLHWVAEIAGVKREWNAKILEQVPTRRSPGRRPRAPRTPARSTSRRRGRRRRRSGSSWSTSPRASWRTPPTRSASWAAAWRAT
jgi:hypothetical protein